MNNLTREQLEAYYADSLQINATLRGENERLKKHVNDYAQSNESLKNERNALAAWSNQAAALFLRVIQSEECVLNNDVKQIVDSETMYDLTEFFENKIPQQCLREVEALSGRKGFKAGAYDAAAYISKRLNEGSQTIDIDLDSVSEKYYESVLKGGA